MKWYRVVKEGDYNGSPIYRVQERGWWRWRDVRYVEHFNVHGPSLSRILRFPTVEQAQEWIENRGGRNETAKEVVATFGVYG